MPGKPGIFFGTTPDGLQFPKHPTITAMTYQLEQVFNEARIPEVTFVPPKQFPYLKSAFRAEGKHITISGPSGSGKTTLVAALLREFSIRSSDILLINGRSYPAHTSFFDVLASELKCSNDYSELVSLLKLVKFVLVDDFHHLHKDARLQLAKTLKLWHESGIRFIIVGIAPTAAELLGADAELGIRNDPFELKTQDESFVRQLMSLGEAALNIRFSDTLKEDIVKACNGVPSVVHVVCRTACIESHIERTGEKVQPVDEKLPALREAILRVYSAKYFKKVLSLAKGKQQARSVHNTYFDIVSTIASTNDSEIPVEYLYNQIVKPIFDSKVRSRKATSFYNCLSNLTEIIETKGLSDILLYNPSANFISVEDPSFRFYLNLLNIDEVKKRIHVRSDEYPWDVAVSFAGEDRSFVLEFVTCLKQKGISVFYDFDQQHKLWGQDLQPKLAQVYADEALYMVVFISERYPTKDWTSFELAVGKSAAEKRTEEYLLPIRMDDTVMVGLKSTIVCADLRHQTMDQIADTLAAKIQGSTSASSLMT
jgi:type II secretory pathway predicted ATPase ExeA